MHLNAIGIDDMLSFTGPSRPSLALCTARSPERWSCVTRSFLEHVLRPGLFGRLFGGHALPPRSFDWIRKSNDAQSRQARGAKGARGSLVGRPVIMSCGQHGAGGATGLPGLSGRVNVCADVNLRPAAERRTVRRACRQVMRQVGRQVGKPEVASQHKQAGAVANQARKFAAWRTQETAEGNGLC